MKLFLAVLSTVATIACATCKPASVSNQDERSCTAYGGRCSLAITRFLSGSEESPANILSYGKFCGRANKCPGLNNANDNANIGDVDPCDDGGLDAACKGHDKCLDDGGVNDPGSERVPVPDRCPCDLA